MIVTSYPVRVCDVCHQPTTEAPQVIGWRLVTYEIDLCPAHADDQANYLDSYLAVSRRLGDPPRHFQPVRPVAAARDLVATSVVRQWAKRTGRPVTDRGRLPDSLFDEYLSEMNSKSTKRCGEK